MLGAFTARGFQPHPTALRGLLGPGAYEPDEVEPPRKTQAKSPRTRAPEHTIDLHRAARPIRRRRLSGTPPGLFADFVDDAPRKARKPRREPDAGAGEPDKATEAPEAEPATSPAKTRRPWPKRVKYALATTVVALGAIGVAAWVETRGAHGGDEADEAPDGGAPAASAPEAPPVSPFTPVGVAADPASQLVPVTAAAA